MEPRENMYKEGSRKSGVSTNTVEANIDPPGETEANRTGKRAAEPDFSHLADGLSC